jgi:lantibiotic biosynthesis protein
VTGHDITADHLATGVGAVTGTGVDTDTGSGTSTGMGGAETAAAGAGSVRAEAEAIVVEVARRLADPQAVTRVTAGAVDRLAGGREALTWHPSALNEGCAGVALLHAELGDRRSAHAFLGAAATAVTPGRGGLFAGLPAVVFATRAAVIRPRDYAGLLDRALPEVRAATRDLARGEAGRIAAGRAGTTFAAYDVVQGLTGLGRLLLAGDDDVAADVVDCLIALARQDVEVGGVRVPGWWVAHAPIRDAPQGDGHVNLALAHGIAGPLALLAIAHRAGLRRPGQEEAIERIAGWLLDRHSGGSWPTVLTPQQLVGAPAPVTPDRPSWCYGSPGIARAIQLAGIALDRPAWRRTAVSALRAALARSWDTWGMIDAGLCHGWAGMLHMTRLVAADDGGEDLAPAVDGLARRVVGCYDPEAPFGFRYAAGAGAAVAPDRAGFLEGAAGIALALHAYVRGDAPKTAWDSALLLA